MPRRSLLAISTAALALAAAAQAQVTVFTSEPAYVAALAEAGCNVLQEGFEDSPAWGIARSPATAREVTSRGITWSSNHPNAVKPTGITTGPPGAARTGGWGFFAMPHGNPDATLLTDWLRDGFIGKWTNASTSLCGAGGWFTGLAGGKIVLVLDGQRTVELGTVGTVHAFLGAIDRSGFRQFEVREVEGKLEDMKFVFADDFTFGVNSSAPNQIAVVSAASYAAQAPIAPGSLASASGNNLTENTAGAVTMPLPEVLGGVAVKITDASGTARAAPLLYVSPRQVNFAVPDATVAGQAVVDVISNGITVASGPVQVERVAPGVFTANADGRGAPAAHAFRFSPDGQQSMQEVFACGATPGSCTVLPIEPAGPGGLTFLTLYGTDSCAARRRTAGSAASAAGSPRPPGTSRGSGA